MPENAFYSRLSRGAFVIARLLHDGVFEQERRLREPFEDRLLSIAQVSDADITKTLCAVTGAASSKWVADVMFRLIQRLPAEDLTGAGMVLWSQVSDGSSKISAVENFLVHSNRMSVWKSLGSLSQRTVGRPNERTVLHRWQQNVVVSILLLPVDVLEVYDTHHIQMVAIRSIAVASEEVLCERLGVEHGLAVAYVLSNPWHNEVVRWDTPLTIPASVSGVVRVFLLALEFIREPSKANLGAILRSCGDSWGVWSIVELLLMSFSVYVDRTMGPREAAATADVKTLVSEAFELVSRPPPEILTSLSWRFNEGETETVLAAYLSEYPVIIDEIHPAYWGKAVESASGPAVRRRLVESCRDKNFGLSVPALWHRTKKVYPFHLELPVERDLLVPIAGVLSALGRWHASAHPVGKTPAFLSELARGYCPQSEPLMAIVEDDAARLDVRGSALVMLFLGELPAVSLLDSMTRYRALILRAAQAGSKVPFALVSLADALGVDPASSETVGLVGQFILASRSHLGVLCDWDALFVKWRERSWAPVSTRGGPDVWPSVPGDA